MPLNSILLLKKLQEMRERGWVDLVVCRTDSALKFGWFFFTYLVSFPFGLVNIFVGIDTSKFPKEEVRERERE